MKEPNVQAECEIVNALGLHARAAAKLVMAANRYGCDVTLVCDGESANGKSIMGVLMLAAAQGMKVTVKCEGEGAPACLDEITKLIADKFGEGR